MLIGEYIHTIDEKNRISMPARFRQELGKKIIITPGLDSCLFIFTIKEWEKVSNRLSDSSADLSFLKADQRNFNRYMFGRAAEVEIDSIGRILIPDFLKERIGLKNSAAIIGVKDRVEIWNDKVWSQNQEVVEKQVGALAESLGNERE
jgi:MraZ protein